MEVLRQVAHQRGYDLFEEGGRRQGNLANPGWATRLVSLPIHETGLPEQSIAQNLPDLQLQWTQWAAFLIAPGVSVE